MREQWRDIKGFEGIYAVSNMGRVYSYRNKIIRKPNYKPEGYPMIRLSKTRVDTIHRLVWETFVGFDRPKQIINHKNSDKRDCRLENLEVCDYSYNIKYAYENGERPLTPVSQYTMEGEFIKSYKSMEEASLAVGVNKSCICSCCKGKARSAKGFLWTYEGEKPNIRKKWAGKFKRVAQYDLQGNFIREWESMKSAKDIASLQNISACCRGVKKTAGGFIWKYFRGDC